MSCISCHTEFPILTEQGRQFKLMGYTQSSDESKLPPFAVMVQPSFTQTNKNQAGGAAPHFGENSNFAFTQASLFYNGRLFGPYAECVFGKSVATFLNKFGTFFQLTFDGVARQLHADNLELRYADSGTIFGQPITYGFYGNNNPGLQDPWNTSPAWTFPFTSSGLAPTPGPGTLIEGALAQQVVGVGGYLMLSHSIYVDVAGYHTLDTSFQKAMGIGIEDETQIPGIAPYWRVAYTKAVGNQTFEVGLSGLHADTYPGRDNSAGEDHIDDLGADAQYQTSFGKSDVTALATVYREGQHWRASQQLGNTTNRSDHLWSTKVAVDYLYDKTYGAAAGYFVLDGSHDPLLYPDTPNGSPLSDGVVLQVNYLPFNKSGGPAFWPRSSVKLSVQYVIYDHFNGTTTDASDNNTLYIESWLAF
jgi:hypothetical protein